MYNVHVINREEVDSVSEKQKSAAGELVKLLEDLKLEGNQKLLGIAFAEGLSVGAGIGSKEPPEDGGEKSA